MSYIHMLQGRSTLQYVCLSLLMFAPTSAKVPRLEKAAYFEKYISQMKAAAPTRSDESIKKTVEDVWKKYNAEVKSIQKYEADEVNGFNSKRKSNGSDKPQNKKRCGVKKSGPLKWDGSVNV